MAGILTCWGRTRCADETVIRGSTQRSPPASAILARNGRVVLQDSQDSPSIFEQHTGIYQRIPAYQPRHLIQAHTNQHPQIKLAALGAPIKCHSTNTSSASASVGRDGLLVGQLSRGAEACLTGCTVFCLLTKPILHPLLTCFAARCSALCCHAHSNSETVSLEN